MQHAGAWHPWKGPDNKGHRMSARIRPEGPTQAKRRKPAPKSGKVGTKLANDIRNDEALAAADWHPIASVERALLVLGVFRAAPSFSLSDLAKRTRLVKSTLLRILATLEQHGCVMRLANGHYRIGGVLFELGSVYAASFQLEDVLRPALRHLSRISGESAAFYVRHGKQRQCLFRVDSQQAVRHVVLTGQILELDGAATSQLLRHYHQSRFRPEPSTAYIELCRSTSGLGDAQTASVAAPIFDTNGFVGVMNISGPVHRFTAPNVERWSNELARTAAKISLGLGGFTT
jgi:DNA-binding IclR family transcriptional regulator